MKANGLLKWLVPAVLLGIVLIIGKSWVAAPDAEPAHDPETENFIGMMVNIDAGDSWRKPRDRRLPAVS